MGNHVIPKRCFQWVGFQQLNLHVAKRFSSSHHGGTTTTPDRPMRENTEGGIQALGNHRPGLGHFWKQPSQHSGWGRWHSLVPVPSLEPRKASWVLVLSRSCWVIAPAVPAHGAFMLNGKPPHRQLCFRMTAGRVGHRGGLEPHTQGGTWR